MATNNYKILMTAESALPIHLPVLPGGEVLFNVSGKQAVTKLAVKNHSRVAESSVSIPELHISAETKDKNLEDAIKRVLPLAQAVISIISFGTQVGISPVRIDRGWDVTSDKKEGEFFQFIYGVPQFPLPPYSLDPLVFGELLNNLTNKPEEFQSRFYRALRWFRNAFLLTHVIDRFISLWIGLETINVLLMEHFNVESELIICEKCKAPQREKSNLGVQRWIEVLVERSYVSVPNLFKELHKLRNKLLHGGGKLSKIESKVKTLSPAIQIALSMGLIELLDCSEKSKNHSQLVSRTSLEVRLEGVLSTSEMNLADLHTPNPMFILDTSLAYIDPSKKEGPILWVSSSPKPLCDSKFRLNLRNVSVVDPEDSMKSIASLGLKIKPRDN